MSRPKKNHSKEEEDKYHNRRVEDDKQKKLLAEKKARKVWLERDREIFIGHLLQMSDIIEEQINKKTNISKVFNLSRSKNILQSLVYLLMNPIFYREIIRIRKKLKIPQCGFSGERKYKDWARDYTKKQELNNESRKLHLKHLRKSRVRFAKNTLCSLGFNRVCDEAEWLVRKYQLAHSRDISRLATVLSPFISRRTKFESFFQKVGPSIYEDDNSFLVEGFDVKVKEFPQASDSFYEYQWTIRLYPFANITGLENMIRDYFEKDMIFAKKNGLPDRKWLKFEMSRHGIDKKQKSNPELSVINGKDAIVLKFTTDFFTKPSQIIQLFKEKRSVIQELLKRKGKQFEDLQKKKLSRNFRRNFNIFKLYKEKKDLSEIYEIVFGEKEDINREDELRSKNVVKGELGEFRANIRDAIKRKIVF